MAYFWLLGPDWWGKLAKNGLIMSPWIDQFDFLRFPWISMGKIEESWQESKIFGFSRLYVQPKQLWLRWSG